MPFIEVKGLEQWFESDEMSERMIAALTDATCSVIGEDHRNNIWVCLQGISPARFGVGGKPAGQLMADSDRR
jgi:4-oxalocrotonate tautomerase